MAVSVPADSVCFSRWVLGTLLTDWLGVAINLTVGLADEFVLSLAGRRLTVPFVPGLFVDGPGEHVALQRWVGAPVEIGASLADPVLPLLGGKPGFVVEGNHARFRFDLVSSAAFVLSGRDALLTAERDAHGRVPRHSSFLGRHSLHHRPLADEYANILAAGISRLWPSLPLKPQAYRAVVSCDVDHPVWPRLWRYIARRNLKGAPVDRLSLVKGLLANRDPYHQATAFLASRLSRVGHEGEFYFIPERTHPLDGVVTLQHDVAQAVAGDVRRLGHRIGIHPGYGCSDRNMLERAVAFGAERIGNPPEVISRYHFLRFDAAVSPGNLEMAGLHTDASVGFADDVGFRVGSARRHRLFDHQSMQETKVWEQPLVVMDASLLEHKYLALSADGAADVTDRVTRSIRDVGGTMTLLLHNTRLLSAAQKQLAERLLEVVGV